MDNSFSAGLTPFIVEKFLIYTEFIQFNDPEKLGAMTAFFLFLFWIFARQARETKSPWPWFGWASLAGVSLVNGGSFLIAALTHWSA
ncbi:hypothetical protein [Rhizobium sullae]|uniref:hypothetical protein n=1 Tax=Rhizobium sullae TaxID=50338 RepID=UPI000B360A2C|nr:hypothetical protein [Rhizobium sullae]